MKSWGVINVISVLTGLASILLIGLIILENNTAESFLAWVIAGSRGF